MFSSKHAALALKTPIRMTKCRHNFWYFCYFRPWQWEERPFNGPTKRITSWHLEIDQRNAVVPHTMGWKANICSISHLIKDIISRFILMHCIKLLFELVRYSRLRLKNEFCILDVSNLNPLIDCFVDKRESFSINTNPHKCGNNYMVLCTMSK